MHLTVVNYLSFFCFIWPCWMALFFFHDLNLLFTNVNLLFLNKLAYLKQLILIILSSFYHFPKKWTSSKKHVFWIKPFWNIFLFVLHADPESIDLQIHYKLLNLIQEWIHFSSYYDLVVLVGSNRIIGSAEIVFGIKKTRMKATK